MRSEAVIDDGDRPSRGGGRAPSSPMNASRTLQRHWHQAAAPQLAADLANARRCIASFADATAASGSLLQSWIGGREVVEFDHYPDNDIVDSRHGSQFYYHAHRDGELERGHLHLFWHATASGRRRHFRPGRPRWSRTAP
ncbi:MAG: hypothetical protein KGN16_26635, partial [Burkholderiales bacterium]|nr:hypothetical protein [Burkholderiales bacterium]